MAGSAFFSEGGALGGLDGSAQDVSGAAESRLLGVNAGDVEALLGVEIAIIRAESPAARGNDADATPGAIGDFEDFSEELLCSLIAVKGDDAAVGVLDFMAAALELRNSAANSFEQI